MEKLLVPKTSVTTIFLYFIEPLCLNGVCMDIFSAKNMRPDAKITVFDALAQIWVYLNSPNKNVNHEYSKDTFNVFPKLGSISRILKILYHFKILTPILNTQIDPKQHFRGSVLYFSLQKGKGYNWRLMNTSGKVETFLSKYGHNIFKSCSKGAICREFGNL